MMTTIPAPSLVLTREEWPDADFDLPDGEPIHSVINRDDDADEDWDIEMSLGKTGGVKALALTSSIGSSHSPQPFTIRPRIPSSSGTDEDDDDDEGVSTIKASAVLPQPVARLPKQAPIDEDIETAFLLPEDLTQLSLAPLSLNHRSSKNSLEWGDKDHTSSSQSSDAYSSLSFADASPSSNSASSVSQPDTGDELDSDDEGVLDGLVIPTGLFDNGHCGRKLHKILEMKKKTGITDARVKIASPDPEDDFEMGLVIDDEVLSPSRLRHATLQSKQPPMRPFNRSTSAPPRQPPSSLRPPSRLKHDRAKSPINPPPSSTRQLQKLRLTPSPPLPGVPQRSQTFQALSPAAPSPPTSFLSPKPGSLRGQKSHSGLKPPTPPSSTRKLTRKASLSSLMETSQAQASGSASGSKARYEEPTYASRAKSHKSTSSRTHDYKVPPTRPCTPSSNQAALRLTMPTQSRSKPRPALSTVWGTPAVNPPDSSIIRTASPLPPRPPSSLSAKSVKPSNIPQPVAPKVLRRPKRQRTYGDGTELDSIEDLPADREKEARYRVQPKGYGNRVPGASYSKGGSDKGTMRKKTREGSESSQDMAPLVPSTNTLKRTASRIESLSRPDLSLPKKKKNTSSPTTPETRRKPTLIRNLGGAGASKVVGDMKWNPQTLRWEGNDHVLRDFDAVVGTSTRPALITHLTGSSIGSPVGSFASGARIVGNMIFDPARMCWISTLPPDEDEPDVFANLADDEDDEDWETKGGTIRASLQGKEGPPSDAGTTRSSASSSEAPSPSRSRTRAMSDSGSDRGSRASMVCDVDDTFLVKCRQAEERHQKEMRGWKTSLSKPSALSTDIDRSYLYEIRALATRKY
ncbi:hypothetical protein ONZ45_g3026 [Pleurotus djamor]|nr:hypothetical protein ONZ45_g3026 [Pleurotus djamor]